MKVPSTLCRITYRRRLLVDKDGYLLSHEPKRRRDGSYTEDINGFDPRTLPMVHPKEWETIARRFAWLRFKDGGRTFHLLTVDAEEIEVVENKPHSVLDYGEYLARVHKSAIISDTEMTWVQDGRDMNLSRGAKKHWPHLFELSKGYSPVPVK